MFSWGMSQCIEPAASKTENHRVPARQDFSTAWATGYELRIATLGTSLTSEWTWRFWRACGGHWVRLLRSELSERYGTRAPVQNLGHWGADSVWALHHLSKICSRRRADIAFIEFAINDADERRGVSVVDSRNNLLAIVDALRDSWPGCNIYLLVTNPVFGRHAPDRPHLGEYYEIVRQVASQVGAGLIDTEPAWREALASQHWRHLLPDGIHPNAKAACVVTLPQIRLALGL